MEKRKVLGVCVAASSAPRAAMSAGDDPLGIIRCSPESSLVEARQLVDDEVDTVLPPVVALTASVALKDVIIALLMGVWVGTIVLNRGRPGLGHHNSLVPVPRPR